jgi:hypothetical protein
MFTQQMKNKARMIDLFGGRYSAVSDGSIIRRSWRGVENYNVVGRISPRGYHNVSLTMPTGERVSFLAHRLICQAFNGPAPFGKNQVNHKNGVKTDNRPDNLEWCDSSHNMLHAHATGLKTNRGERNPKAVLNYTTVAQVRAKRAAGAKLKDLSRDYGITMSAISMACRGKSWGVAA